MQKVWNISDHPGTGVTARTIMVMGRSVAPGHFVRVESGRLARAHKIHKDVAAKLLYIGNAPPADYLKLKSPKRTALPRDVSRIGHGEVLSGGVQQAPPKAPVIAPPEDSDDTFRRKRRRGAQSEE